MPALFSTEMAVQALHLEFAGVQAMGVSDGLNWFVVLLVAGEVNTARPRHQVERAEQQPGCEENRNDSAIHWCTITHFSVAAALIGRALCACEGSAMYFRTQAIDKDKSARKTNTMKPMA